MINIGTSTINAVKLGTTNISAVYIGTTKLYPVQTLDWFYVEDASGAANTVSITKDDANAPTLTIETSTDGSTWTTLGTTSTTALDISVPANGKVYVRCNATVWCDTSQNCNAITSTGDFNVGGNIMSLLYGSNFDGTETAFPSASARAFQSLFYRATHLVDASRLTLPATTLATYCYSRMFMGCTALTAAPTLPATTLVDYCYYCMFGECSSLTTAPALPATTLASFCYQQMFLNCTSLTTAPTLNATTLASNCYNGMFSGCTSLTTAPALNSTSLAGGCYRFMFQNCTSLTTAPTLNATTLVDYCYNGMFSGCTSLTTAPTLNATTLVNYCYGSMFSGCTSLTTAPALPATTLATYCYYQMFQNCTSLTTAPELNATTLVNSCYYQMFSGCSRLSSVRTKATTWNETYASNWLSGVAASGTFYNDGNATIPTSSASGIPSGWTEVTNKDWFYFENATGSANTVSIKKNNTNAPTLSIQTSTNKTTWTTLGSTSTTALNISIPANGKVYVRCSANSWSSGNTYYHVVSSTGNFNVGGNIMSLLYGSNFTGNETAFPSGSTRSFHYMFYNATRLVNASALKLPATTLVSYCYQSMFRGCSSLTTAPALPATTLATYCYSNMFRGCSSLTTAPATLPATTLAQYCYEDMFTSCAALTTAPTLNATTLAKYCCQRMFNSCSHLTSIKVAFTSWPSTTSSDSTYRATYNWTYGLPASGTFYKKSGLSSSKNASGNTTTGDAIAGYTNAIPYNWTVTNY